MKYSSYIGGSILGTPVFHSFRSANSRFRASRRLPTFRCGKVTSFSTCKCSVNPYRFCSSRQASTDSRKNQMSVVGAPKVFVLPPNPVEINKFISSIPEKRSSNKSLIPLNLPTFPRNLSAQMTFGEFLSSSPINDPFTIESVFLPTFHSFQDEFQQVFGPHPVLIADPEVSPANEPPPEENERDQSHSEQPSSYEESLDVSPQSPESCTRAVTKGIVLPRDLKFENSLDRLQIFLDVHRFDETDDKNNKDKRDNIGEFPHVGDNTLPTGQFIIHSERSSFIINKDLYITNRILDKLKKRDKEPSTDAETSEPIIKHSSVVDDTEDAKIPPLVNEVDDKLHLNRLIENSELTIRPANKSKSDTHFPPSIQTCMNPTPKGDSIIAVENIPLEQELIPFKAITKYCSSDDIPSSVENNIDINDFTRFRSNAEFSNPPIERLSPLELKAFESRKNLYKRLLRNTPCYLVDGLHVQIGNPKDLNENHTFPERCFNRGDSEEISNTIYLPEEVDEAILWDSPILGNEKDLNEWKNDEVYEGQMDDLEEWFVPLGKEIDSMLMTLSAAKSVNPLVITLNPDSKKLACVYEDNMDFKDLVDNIGVSENFVLSGDHFEREMIPFEGLEDIESALSNSNCDPSTPGSSGLARFSSSSTTQKTPHPPKQSNPNVDIKTETIIKCCRSGGNTDINVIETQRYLDKRLPYPFSTETVLQVYGTNESLFKATQAVENSKSQLVHLSNANTPNPGMTIPKLQFNHMLSKTHELTNHNSNKKKRVFKIKIVPESGSSYSIPPKVSSTEPNTASHVMDISKHPSSSINREVVELQKKSKYSHRATSKKLRRSESAKQLRSRKKQSVEDIEENITVLSSKDLDRMFPAPPKPKPVEKPRNVTISSQAANTNAQYNALNLVETSNAITKITLKAKKKNDQWLLVNKKLEPSRPDDSEARPKFVQASSKVEKDPAKNVISNNEGGLSQRDQKILKTIISHKVKGSFSAVSQREKNRKEATQSETDKQVRKSAEIVLQRLSSSGNKMEEASDKAIESKQPTNPMKEVNRLEDMFKASRKVPSTKFEESKVVKDQDGAFDDPLGLVVGRKPNKLQKEMNRDGSPTPIENREEVSINSDAHEKQPETKLPTPRSSQKDPIKTHTQRFEGDEYKVIQPIMSSIVPLSPKVTISSQGNAQPSQNNSNNPKIAVSSGKLAEDSNVDQSSKSNNANLNSNKGDVGSKLDESHKLEEREIQSRSEALLQRVGKNRVTQSFHEWKKSPQQLKKKWQISEPMFFPFETPSVKELLDHNISTPLGDSLPFSSSSPDSKFYEVDFCKLGPESKPDLDALLQSQCKVPLTKVKKFPMINESKFTYSAPKTIISVKPHTDLMLRRKLSQMPAVTKVLGATLSAKSQQALERWKEGLVSTLGEDGFKMFVEKQLKQGSNFHSAVSKYLLEKIDSTTDPCMKSMSSVFPHITEVGVIESQVVHPQLAYRGVVDCVAKYKGKPVAIEWKKSDKSKPSLKHTYDAPLQLSAYIGALNFDDNYKLQVEGGLVVVAYSDGSPADVFDIPLEECQRYWSMWLKRLYKFYSRT